MGGRTCRLLMNPSSMYQITRASWMYWFYLRLSHVNSSTYQRQKLVVRYAVGIICQAFAVTNHVSDMPIIGNAMRMARHVFLKRNDIRSTMECMEQVTNRLQEGSSMVFFAEGTRSPDGRLRR